MYIGVETYPRVDPRGSISAYDLKYFSNLECFIDRDFSFMMWWERESTDSRLMT